MLDQPNGASKTHAPLPAGPAKMLVDLVAQGLGAQERRCLEAGVPVQELIGCLLNHAASLAAIVGEAWLRNPTTVTVGSAAPTPDPISVFPRQPPPSSPPDPAVGG